MPIIQVSTPNNEAKIYNHEPNRRIRSVDLNTLSGASLADSNLQMLMQLTKALTGNFDSVLNTYLGFKLSTYTSTVISALTGYVVTNTGVYKLPTVNLTPNSGAYWGFYELEFVEDTSDSIGLDFFDGIVGSFVNSPTRKVFRLNVYENYNNTPSYPTLTPGRVKWIEYKRSGASPADSIVFVNNLITRDQASIFGFSTGDIKYAMKPGDDNNWVTCTGGQVSNSHIDLISFLREVKTNPTPISFTSLDSNSGLVRLTVPGITNLKNVRFGVDPKYSCVTILTSTGSITPVPMGVYKIENITGSQITLQLSYSANYASATGTFDLSPFAKEDNAGGGARTPFPDFIRGFNPNGNLNDVNRLFGTYQDDQTGQHLHNNTVSASSSVVGDISGSLSGVATADLTEIQSDLSGKHRHLVAGGNGNGNSLISESQILAANQSGTADADYSFSRSDIDEPFCGKSSNPVNSDNPTINEEEHFHTFTNSDPAPVDLSNVTIDIDTSGLTINSSGTIDNVNNAAMDSDNPTVTRPDNVALYLLIKT